MIGIALAGGLGALLRGELAALSRRKGWALGRATLVVNVIGALLLGLAVGAWGVDGVWNSLSVGFLGGFTTFSTWMTEALDLEGRSPGGPAVRWQVIAAMLVVGVGAAAGGYALGGLV